jgi:hypothetical protein
MFARLSAGRRYVRAIFEGSRGVPRTDGWRASRLSDRALLEDLAEHVERPWAELLADGQATFQEFDVSAPQRKQFSATKCCCERYFDESPYQTPPLLLLVLGIGFEFAIGR